MTSKVTHDMELAEKHFSSCNYHEALVCFKNNLGISQSQGNTNGIGKAYSGMADCYVHLNMYAEAVECYEKFLDILQAIEDRRKEGEVYFRLGFCCRKLGKNDCAQEYFSKGLNIAKESGDKETQSDCCFILGIVYRRSERLQESLKAFEQYLETALEIGCSYRERRAYKELCYAYYLSGKTPEAIDFYHRFFEVSLKSGDKTGEHVAYHNLGLCYQKIGDLEKYLDCITKSAAIAREIGDLQIELSAYGHLENIKYNQGKFDEAITYSLKRLEIAVKTGDKCCEAKIYNDLGNAFKGLGKYSDATNNYNRSIDIEFQLGHKSDEGVVYNNLGLVFICVGRYNEAIACLHKFYQTAIGNIEVEKMYYQHLATAFLRLGKVEEARECRLRFIILAVQTGDRLGEIWFYQELAECFNNQGETEKCIKYYEKALDIALKTNNRTSIAYAYDEIARCYSKLRKHAESIKFEENSLKIYCDLNEKSDQARCLGNLGGLYRSLALENQEKYDQVKYHQFMQQSEMYLTESFVCYNGLFDELRQYDEFLKLSFVDTFLQFSKALTTVLVENMKYFEALEVLEFVRAQILTEDLLTRYHVDAVKTDKMDFTDNRILVCSLTALQCPTMIFWVISPKEKTFLFFEHMMAEPYFAKDKVYVAIQYINNVVDSAYQSLKVRETINCEDRSLGIHKYSDEDGDGEHLQTHSSKSALGINERLESTFFESGLLISGSNHSRETGSASIQPEQRDECKEPLKELFKELITPVQQCLTEDEIVIVPEGPLYLVPFAALQDPQTGRFLFETKRIRLAPSLTTLRLLKDCPSNYHSKTGALVIGNPRVGEVTFRGEIKTFDNLPAAEREAEVISALLGVEPLTGIHATKDAVKEKLRDGSAVIHIAAHGDNTNGQIVLAPDISAKSKAIPDEEDYILTMKEVQEIGVRAQLVVLSCCHSGRGEIRAEGVVGMSRAFLAAGARAVVASLWAIDDHATLEFMSSFYMYLKFGKSASLSLQKTMKELRESRRYRHPRFWAPFFLIGDDVTLTKT